MAGELATLQQALSAVGVESDSDDAAVVLRYLRAISTEIKGKTNRQFVSVATVYDMVLDADGQADIILPHVPVTDLLSINRVFGDGTEEAIAIPNIVGHDGVASWNTLTSQAVAIGDTNIKVDDITDIAVGDHMEIVADEVVRVTTVGTAGVGGTGLDIEPAARFSNVSGSAVKHVAGSTGWYLGDTTRGRVFLAGHRRLLRVIWRVDGGVPDDIREATVSWLADRWATRDRTAGQTAYTTGDDSEDFDAAMVGTPPANVAMVLGRYWRNVRNGVI